MRHVRLLAGASGVALAAVFATAWAAEGRHGSCTSCTGPGLQPRCKASWGEAKTKQPEYAMQCEYACARARDPWHAPEPECRCSPPCGSLYVKKRLYKTEQEKVERVPKYEVQTVPAGSCGCGSCAAGGHSGWDPLGLWSRFRHQ
jgi:hypothetical protein